MRTVWFAAGAAAGVYGMVKVRRIAEALTPDGMRDRVGAAFVGARLFRDEVAQGAADAMDAEGIQSIVVSENRLQLCHGARPTRARHSRQELVIHRPPAGGHRAAHRRSSVPRGASDASCCACDAARRIREGPGRD